MNVLHYHEYFAIVANLIFLLDFVLIDMIRIHEGAYLSKGPLKVFMEDELPMQL